MNRERRAYPRINKSIELRLATRGFDIHTKTKNISCAGAYCEVDRLIPDMTRLDILLFLPDIKNEKKTKRLRIKGVVVRSSPNILNEELISTNIAIFFTDIKKADRKAIFDFVNYYLDRV
ncbi:MAG: PilZ domain-containing protein [Candidatus Omnitrophica bacterium]|nr:PilZ domain-containing protein [Candidatus Omnitrophota bacterium]